MEDRAVGAGEGDLTGADDDRLGESMDGAWPIGDGDPGREKLDGARCVWRKPRRADRSTCGPVEPGGVFQPWASRLSGAGQLPGEEEQGPVAEPHGVASRVSPEAALSSSHEMQGWSSGRNLDGPGPLEGVHDGRRASRSEVPNELTEKVHGPPTLQERDAEPISSAAVGATAAGDGHVRNPGRHESGKSRNARSGGHFRDVKWHLAFSSDLPEGGGETVCWVWLEDGRCPAPPSPLRDRWGTWSSVQHSWAPAPGGFGPWARPDTLGALVSDGSARDGMPDRLRPAASRGEASVLAADAAAVRACLSLLGAARPRVGRARPCGLAPTSEPPRDPSAPAGADRTRRLRHPVSPRPPWQNLAP